MVLVQEDNMERLDGISAKILDNLDNLIKERINSNYTKNYHQENLFEGGLYGGARSVTDVSTGSEENHMSVGIRSGTVGM